MTPDQEIDYILNDCFFAVGQIVGTRKHLDLEAIVWWRRRYREKFLQAMTGLGNSWGHDRRRVVAVARYLGERALHHAGNAPTIDLRCVELASADVETGCRMHALGDSGVPARCAS